MIESQEDWEKAVNLKDLFNWTVCNTNRKYCLFALACCNDAKRFDVDYLNMKYEISMIKNLEVAIDQKHTEAEIKWHIDDREYQKVSQCIVWFTRTVIIASKDWDYFSEIVQNYAFLVASTISVKYPMQRVVTPNKRQCDIFREIIGSPGLKFRVNCNDTVKRMAKAIYNNKDWQSLPILADALEESGCTDSMILDHFRNDTFHVKGCWALDLLIYSN